MFCKSKTMRIPPLLPAFNNLRLLYMIFSSNGLFWNRGWEDIFLICLSTNVFAGVSVFGAPIVDHQIAPQSNRSVADGFLSEQQKMCSHLLFRTLTGRQKMMTDTAAAKQQSETHGDSLSPTKANLPRVLANPFCLWSTQAGKKGFR